MKYLYMGILVLFACCKKADDANQDSKLVPVRYYLSNEDKSMLDYLGNSKTIVYADQNGNEIVFNADSLYDITEKEESNLFRGEELCIRYNCASEYFPNYSFVISLYAVDSFNVELEIMFGTGTYWNDRHNDYVLSGFIIDPKSKESVDTSYSNYLLRFDYYDTLTLRTTQFYGIYHIWDDIFDLNDHVTTDCYYSNQQGVVAFKNLDGKFWIRKDE